MDSSPTLSDPLAQDVARISRIAAVPSILEVVCRTTGMGFAAVARVTEDRWVVCAVRDEISFGLTPGGELKIETTICDEIRDSGEAVVIDHVAEDEAFRSHHTPAMYGFQSYISMPIIQNGEFFGTLCAIDPRPARLNNVETIGMFKLFAELIAQHMDAQDRLAESEAALLSAQEANELGEQYMAVLGHDLRNPLASIQGAARLVMKTPLNERAQMMMGMMQGSVERMAVLIDNVMEFTRARLGNGDIGMVMREDAQLTEALQLAVDELRMIHPQRDIVCDIAIDGAVVCDRQRLARLLSNLLGNALTHGDVGSPVKVTARTGEQGLVVTVANAGAPIPPQVAERLFQPFTRAAVAPSNQGLGLGLYIASQIARGHGGTLGVESDAAETRFIFSMPLAKR